ncbi:MAG: hypothetical protein FWE56_01985 [Candidatus Bathyarchaeota archaeon]|nr:hypothetical protein [Candidatus Termiticorpusculum sp.]MCL2868389.1 hypothetical protein [Candidatus Termiticorpusculum sp.]
MTKKPTHVISKEDDSKLSHHNSHRIVELITLFSSAEKNVINQIDKNSQQINELKQQIQTLNKEVAQNTKKLEVYKNAINFLTPIVGSLITGTIVYLVTHFAQL